MKINRFMIAAPKSGSGKTMITCALLQLLKDSGKNVLSYKCGPDYIDPMFHKKVLGVPSKNLDTFFTDEKTTVQLFLDERADGEYYYAASSGVISAQWVKSGNNWYYVDANGKMVTGDYKINGVVNRFDINGVWLR